MRALKITALVLTAFVVLAGAATGLYAWHNLTWFQRSWRSVEEAGYRESAILIDGVRLNYGESPGKEKPPLLLIHGQGTDWRSYVDVLPGLAESFHVFAVDVPGHGGSDRWRSHYSAVEISDLLAGFMDRVIAQPAVVSGHSSGGQIAALVATRHEERVTGLVLEDPPFFTTELPRARQTWNWVDLASNCHHFLESGETDWVAWQWRHQRMWRFFGPAAPWIIESGLNYHARHPHEPIEIWFLPPSVMVLQRTMVTYDPWFGQAFYDGSWNNGFHHAATLAAIEEPTVYLRAAPTYGGDGVLQGAVDDEEFSRIRGLLPRARFLQTDSGHDIHGAEPELFVEQVRSML